MRAQAWLHAGIWSVPFVLPRAGKRREPPRYKESIMVNDPVGDFIIRIKNANAVKHERVAAPYSKLKHAIADKLREKGYVKSVTKRGKKTRKHIEVELVRDEDAGIAIHNVKRVSKPGRRVYVSADTIRPVRHGKGVLMLSTPRGILTGDEARKARVGGEALFEIW